MLANQNNYFFCTESIQTNTIYHLLQKHSPISCYFISHLNHIVIKWSLNGNLPKKNENYLKFEFEKSL